MKRDYQQAWRDAKRLLVPPALGGDKWGTTDDYRLARAQWLYDYVSRKMGEADLKDLNMFRASREFEEPGKWPPLDLRR